MSAEKAPRTALASVAPRSQRSDGSVAANLFAAASHPAIGKFASNFFGQIELLRLGSLWLAVSQVLLW